MSHWRDIKEFKPYMWLHGIYAIVYTRLPDGNIMVDDNRLNTCNKSEGVTFMYGGDALLELQDAVILRARVEELEAENKKMRHYICTSCQLRDHETTCESCNFAETKRG